MAFSQQKKMACYLLKCVTNDICRRMMKITVTREPYYEMNWDGGVKCKCFATIKMTCPQRLHIGKGKKRKTLMAQKNNVV